MWNLDDKSRYLRVLSFNGRCVHIRRRAGTLIKRERVRAAAIAQIPKPLPSVAWWAFRITIHKGGDRPLDIENAVKIIVDSFSQYQIRTDSCEYKAAGLSPDDAIDRVRNIQVYGERADNSRALVEVYRRRPDVQ